MDGQILGQLCPLAEREEEEEGARAAAPARPAFPGMDSEELRLASFDDWPLTAAVQPELLAAAGFFHTGECAGLGAIRNPSGLEPPPPSRAGLGLTQGGAGVLRLFHTWSFR